MLELRGLLHALTDAVIERKVDMQAALVLLESMDDRHRIQVQAEATARDIMNNLQRQYADTSANNKHQLLPKFFGMQKQGSDTMPMHFGRMKELRATLVSLGETISEDLSQVAVIRSIPGDISAELMK